MKSSAGHWSASPHGNSARYSSIAHQRGEGGKLAERNILIQPMSIGHTDLHGIPVGRQHRPRVVWYGDLLHATHQGFRRARRGQRSGQLRVEADAISNRKATAKSLWRGAGA